MEESLSPSPSAMRISGTNSAKFACALTAR
jgi:hypothetical protein